MKRIKYWCFLTFVFLVLTNPSPGKDITFYSLDKSDGLSDNTVTSVLTDKNGLLWIGTNNGLNSYDGYSVKNYYSRDYPGLVSDQIVRMVCDDKNRIWIQCSNGHLSVFDEKRLFSAPDLTINNQGVVVDYLLPVSDVPLFLNNGLIYSLQENSMRFTPVEMQYEPLLNNNFERINNWDEDKLVFSGSGLLFLFDVKNLKVIRSAQVPGIVAAARLTDDIAIVTLNDHKLYKVSLSTGNVIQEFPNLKDQYGEAMHNLSGSIFHLSNQQFLITSPSAGVYVFDAYKETLIRYHHDIFDNRSISTNHTSYIFSNDEGFYFIASFGMGLNYFKLNSRLTNIKTVFKDSGTGKIYDGYVNSITEDKRGNVWMAGSNTLIEWNMVSGEIMLHPHSMIYEQNHRGGIRTLYIDQQDRIWAGTAKGLVVFSRNLAMITYLNKESGLPDNTINGITESPHGSLWVSTSKGICFIDPTTFDIRVPEQDSPLSIVKESICNTIWFKDEEEVWIGTWDGAYLINLSNGNINTYTTENGLIFNEVIGFEGDESGCVYIGTRSGFHILTPEMALQSFRNVYNTWPVDCFSMVKGRSGDIWFSGSHYITSYSPMTDDFMVYDERSGINPSGFRFYAAHTTKQGILIFGANRGITYFSPENIHLPDLPLSVFIHNVETIDSNYFFIPGTAIELPYSTNTVSFSFSAVNLLRGKNIFYQYQLEGVDNNFKKTSSGQRITYNNLQPGTYAFSVKASGDGVNWNSGTYPVIVHIKTPWWLQHWFSVVSLLIVTAIAMLVIRQWISTIRHQQEELETEKAINYLATSLHEQKTVESILWDVTKNCIGRLKLEDCVIYLVDEKRDVLLQKAAWGPKTTEENKIVNPIEIPIGKGIVGSVAKNGKAEIIHDTTTDNRYIKDDAWRHSEITVPIIYEGKVLGVIDSEHSKKGFFTSKHLSVFTTIASLCANKMIRAKAEKEKQEAQLATLRHEREAVEAQLKSLRLQMNPHFLFNSLNSIQQMILAGEDMGATRYLSKFSRLLRLVLLHSDRENITLKEEMETLNLYVELESLRFKESFRYNIICNEGIDPEEIKVPVMLIQPFVENAIWHGLMHKKGERYLKIEFSEDKEENMVCIIEDNGIGRKAAAKINNDNHTRKGIAVAEERLKTHNAHQGLQYKVWIDDIKDDNKNAAGTRVVLRLH